MGPMLTSALSPEIAAYLVESADVAAASPDEIVSAVFERWAAATADEIEEAIALSLTLRLARLEPDSSELHRLIERTRLLFGAQKAAEMLLKYRASERLGSLRPAA